MSKTVACVVVRSSKSFAFLGHMPTMNWAMSKLMEVRGIDRIVCAVEPKLLKQAAKLLAGEGVEIVPIPKGLKSESEKELDAWFTSAGGPAFDADIVVVTKVTSPFLPAAKIEACLDRVARKKFTHCVPARDAQIVLTKSAMKAAAKEAVRGVRAFRVKVPAERAAYGTVPVTLLDSLDVDNQDEFVLAAAMVDGDRI